MVRGVGLYPCAYQDLSLPTDSPYFQNDQALSCPYFFVLLLNGLTLLLGEDLKKAL